MDTTLIAQQVINTLWREAEANGFPHEFSDFEIEVEVNHQNFLVVVNGSIDATIIDHEYHYYDYDNITTDLTVSEFYIYNKASGELDDLPTQPLTDALQYAS